MFAGMGLCALFPVLHGLKLYGYTRMGQQIGLTWLVLQGLLYLTGALLYAVSKMIGLEDQRVLTKTDAFSGVSIPWQSRHLWCIPSDISCFRGFGGSISSGGSIEGLRLQARFAGQSLLAIVVNEFHTLKSAFVRGRLGVRELASLLIRLIFLSLDLSDVRSKIVARFTISD